MSASAELYITIDTDGMDSRPAIEAKVEDAVSFLGYDPMDTAKYSIGRYQSGIIIEAKGYSVSYDVFQESWAEKLVRDIYAIDDTSDVEVYVYNLDREADVQVSSRYLGLDKEPQGCKSCGNVDHKCACFGGVGRQTPVEVIK
jgi:hypothetical protein